MQGLQDPENSGTRQEKKVDDIIFREEILIN